MKTYDEKRFFKWVEDDVAVSLRAKSGSYGGGSEVLVVDDMVSYGFKPRQSTKARTLGYEMEKAPTINTDENYGVLTIGNGIAYGYDSYNQTAIPEVAHTLKSNQGGDDLPRVIVFRDDITIKIDEDGSAFTLGARDFKGVQCVCYDNVKAVSIGNGQLHNMNMTEIANPLDCMHDAQAILIK